MDITKWTRRERYRLALSMVQPIRCGGGYWRDGVYYIMIGGQCLNPTEFSDWQKKRHLAQLAAIARFEQLTDEEFERIYPATASGVSSLS